MVETIKIATWNANGLSDITKGKIDALLNVINSEEINIAVVSNIRQRGSNDIGIGQNGHKMYFSGVSGGTKRSGIATVLDATWSRRVKSVIKINDNIMLTKLEYKPPGSQEDMLLLVIAVYVTETQTETFYKVLKKVMQEHYENQVKPCNLILMGNLNASIGVKVRPNVTGEYGNPNKINTNGQRLITFAEIFKLRITNTYFPSEINYTFTPYETLLDYIVVDEDFFDLVEYTKILGNKEENPMLTNRHLVYAVIKLKQIRQQTGLEAAFAAASISTLSKSELIKYR